jgi:hypothetical protein
VAIDFWALTKDFAPGDYVQRVVLGQGLTPYMGRVVAVLPGIGFVDVQWPFGNERVSPEELVKMNPKFSPYLPPEVTFSYFPELKARQASGSAWRTTEVPAGFHKELARVFHKGAGEVHAYDELWHRYASFSDDEALRDEVGKFYRFASNSLDMFLDYFAQKTATYWVSQNRTHRATRSEVDVRKPNCPRCGAQMRKTTYKMAEGQRVRLFACPKDLYLIKQADILGPEGSPVEW